VHGHSKSPSSNNRHLGARVRRSDRCYCDRTWGANGFAFLRDGSEYVLWFNFAQIRRNGVLDAIGDAKDAHRRCHFERANCMLSFLGSLCSLFQAITLVIWTFRLRTIQSGSRRGYIEPLLSSVRCRQYELDVAQLKPARQGESP
jgi:hypothetical protein